MPLPKVDVHLTEASQKLTRVQKETLASHLTEQQIAWHPHFDSAMKALNGPTIFIGHEFLDALPIHKFQRVNRGSGSAWREILVDIDDSAPENAPKFRYVLARGQTPAQVSFTVS